METEQTPDWLRLMPDSVLLLVDLSVWIAWQETCGREDIKGLGIGIEEEAGRRGLIRTGNYIDLF